MKKLLVAIDDCEVTTIESPAMQRVIELAGAFSSRVWLLHVVPEPRPGPFNVDRKALREGFADEFHHEHQHLQQLAQCLRVRGVDSCALLVEGPPVDTILEKSKQLGVDLVILVCRKHGSLFGALTGAPRERLLGRCPRPIMFVPEG
ncbi:MAG: universal stress protein [Pseudomonadota bacterium]|nr:universal stress protein [Pseudomonadota bacterium]